MPAKELAQRWRTQTQKEISASWIAATIVSVEQDTATGTRTTFRVLDVDGQVVTNLVWVKFYGGEESEIHEAYNVAVKAKANLPVWLRETQPGKYEIIKTRAKEADELLGAAADSYANPDKNADLANVMVTDRNYKLGRVSILSDTQQLTVRVAPFWYVWNGAKVRFPGGTLDISGNLPSTTDYWQWVLIAVDPDDNSLTALEGTETALYGNLTDSSAADIDSTGYVDTDYVKVQEGMTATDGIDREEFFLHGRVSIMPNQMDSVDLPTSPAVISGTATIAAGRRALWDGPLEVTGTLTVNGSLRILE